MRITPEQINTILATIGAQVGAGASVVLFGSRMRDNARGGDIDLLVESTHTLSLMQQARLKLALEDLLQIPVDIVTKQKDVEPKPFQAIALMTGVPLGITQ
ncbi:MAG: nucleotidyltransferase family protein [Burkholderiales bacterium]